MKRKIALLLALVMVLSMVPMMAFAASDNRVNKVPTVKEDLIYDDGTSPDSAPLSDAPRLIIKEESTDWGNRTQKIRLKLDNAEWIDIDDAQYATLKTNVTNAVYSESTNIDRSSIVVTRDSASTVSVQFKKINPNQEEATFVLPMFVEITDTGDISVEIDGRDSEVTSGTRVFARSSDGNAVVTIDGDVTLSDKEKELKTIEINETSPGAYHTSGTGTKTVKLKLSSGFVWSQIPTITTSGGYNSITSSDYTVTPAGDDTLEITFKAGTLNKTTSRGTIFIKGLKIEAEIDAKYGEVNVRVTGTDIENANLLVAKYKDYGVKVEAAGDAKEIVAGKREKDTDEAHELQKLIIKEDIAKSWLENRKTEIEFPSWVKIRKIEVNKDKNISGRPTFNFDKAGNKVEFTFNKSGSGTSKAELELTFYVSVEADATGDITALVSGKALDEEHEVELGKAIAPIEVKTDVKDVKIGVQKQELGKITLTENVAGAFMKGEDVLVELEEHFRWAKDPNVKVVDGEGLVIDRVKTDKEKLTFRVTRESDKPATIEITGIEVDLYRTLPEGEFKVYVGGKALVQNNDENFNFENYKAKEVDYDDETMPFFKTKWVAEPVIARVVTPAPDAGTGAKEVVLTIGSTTMFVDGVSETANAAPYIDSADRTMLPVSAIGRALGAKVEWNNAARTVLVTKGNDRVLLTIGKDVMNVNGMEIPMRSKAVITNERTFVPLKDLGVALGVNVEWDAATRTVTIK